ncbi:MAG TPA: ABC transporter permease [Tepidisphaeraceae bacterium]|jgi:ABC-type polysaccharide/polyol phosphate export permease|nr:ABC transporter permease [Tepidisphaeraceae bacterium]
MTLTLWQYRRFIFVNALADLRHRYAGTGMGILWNVIHPLAVIAVYSIVFSTLMATSADEVPVKYGYVVYLCSGLFPWMALADCITRSCNAFITNASYLKKLPIPEQVFVAQNAATTLMNLCLNFALLIAISLILGLHPKLSWLLLPIPLISMITLGFGVGLLLGTLNVFFRDLSEWTNIFLQIAMWTVPIVYVPRILPKSIQALLPWHPIGGALGAVHDLFLKGTMPSPALWIGMIAWPLAMLAISLIIFAKLRDEIRDVV